MPVGDAAYFTVRSRDVLTAHHPLLGAWSSGSSVVGVPVNNLGPLQLDLLAPFTRVAPYLGTGIGAALANAAAVTAVWVAARRLLGPWRVVAVMAGTLALDGDARAVVADRRPPAERTAAAAVRPVLARRGDGGRLGRGRADRCGSRQRDRADALHVRVPGAGAQRLRGGRLRRRHASAIAAPLGAHGGLGRRRRRAVLDPAADRPAVGSRQPRRRARTGPPHPGRRRAACRRGGARRRRAHAAVVAPRLVAHLPAARTTASRSPSPSIAVRRVARRRRGTGRVGPPHRRSGRGGAGVHRRGRPRRRAGGGRPGPGLGVRPGAAELLLALGRRGLRHDRARWSGRARWRRWPARCTGRSVGAVCEPPSWSCWWRSPPPRCGRATRCARWPRTRTRPPGSVARCAPRWRERSRPARSATRSRSTCRGPSSATTTPSSCSPSCRTRASSSDSRPGAATSTASVHRGASTPGCSRGCS